LVRSAKQSAQEGDTPSAVAMHMPFEPALLGSGWVHRMNRSLRSVVWCAAMAAPSAALAQASVEPLLLLEVLELELFVLELFVLELFVLELFELALELLLDVAVLLELELVVVAPPVPVVTEPHDAQKAPETATRNVTTRRLMKMAASRIAAPRIGALGGGRARFRIALE
jgi:hypothetical protein